MSNFLNSDFFKRIIIPYKDGQQLQLPVQAVAIVTASGTTSSQDVIIRDWDTDPITLFNVGTGLFSGGKFTPAVAGNYTFAASFQFDQILNPKQVVDSKIKFLIRTNISTKEYK